MADLGIDRQLAPTPVEPIGRLVDWQPVPRPERGQRASSSIGYAWIAVAAITIVAAALRLYGLTSKSVWYDEAFVITLAQMPVQDMLAALIALDPHPPLYYLFMHMWTALGTDPLFIRMPSVVFSTLSVPLIYAVGVRASGSTRVGIAAAAMLAFSPFHISWAQEARMYSMLGLISLGSSYFLMRALQGGRRRNWAAVSILTAAALYTQFNAVFYMAAQNLAVLLLMVRSERLRASQLRAWLLSGAAAAAGFAFWIPAFVQQNVTYREMELAYSSVRGVESMLFQFAFDNLPYWRISWSYAVELRDTMVLGTLLLALLGVWSIRGRKAGVLLAFLFWGTVGLLVLVAAFRSILVPKSVISATFAFYLLIAAGLASFNRRTVLIAGVAGFIVLSSVGLVRYYSAGSQEDWQMASSYLREQVRTGEPVLVDAGAGLMPLNYHLSQSGSSMESYGVPFKPWAVLPPPLSDEDFRQVDQIAAGRSAVWLVVYRNGFPDPDGQLLPYLASRFGLADSRTLTKIKIYRFVEPTQ